MLAYANLSQPWSSTLPTLLLLRKCTTSKDLHQIHARLITTGLIRNATLTARIILQLSASPLTPLIDFARNLFFSSYASGLRRNQRDPFLWNAIIRSYSHGRHPEKAFSVLCWMLEDGIFGDKFSFSLVLKACTRADLQREGFQVHGLLRKIEFGSDLFLQNCLIKLYIHCGCLGCARRLFDKMSERDSVSYNSIIDGYVKRGMLDLARELLDGMPVEERNSITWNSMINGYARSGKHVDSAWELFVEMPHCHKDLITWNSMVDGFVKCGKMKEARALFDRMPRRDVISCATMIDGYAKLGRLDVARALFAEMPERDVISCNAMMAGYVRHTRGAEALEIFYHMQFESKLLPDTATMLIVLSAIAQLGCAEKGSAVHRYLEECKFPLDGRLGVALIDMYSKCGSIDKATSVFEGIEERNVDHWNAMIGGFAIHGMGELAFALLLEMERSAIEPDDITFIGVLNACGHAGMLKEGLICFEAMRRVHKMEPRLQHYGCLVDMLGRSGQINEARLLIEQMPFEPNDVIWRTLLSACKSHGNLSVGEPVAKQLMLLDSSNSSSYVLLANIYAGLGMWNDVSRIRRTMKQRKLEKIPGCSWIELEGDVHEFFVQDKTNSRSTEIYALLDTLAASDSKFRLPVNLQVNQVVYKEE